MAEKTKKIVILGGGAAGLMAANRLRKTLGASEAAIAVIERSDKHTYQPGLLTMLFDIDRPESLTRNVKDLLIGGIELVTDAAVGINPEGRRVTTRRSGEVRYDYLVIATGAKLYLDEPEGVKEGLEAGQNVFSFYSMEYALKLRDALRSFTGGRIVSTIVEMPIKCPAAPVQFILLAEAEMRRRGIRDKCEFLLTTPGTSVPPSLEPYAGYLERLLRERGIEVMTEFSPSKIDGRKAVCKDFLGQQVAFDLLSVIPSHTGDEVVQNSVGVGDPMGWVTCDKSTLRHRQFDSIYAIGDTANFPSGKTASAALKHSRVLADRLKGLVRGKDETAVYDGNTICPIVTTFGKAFFVEYDYSRSISPAKESYANWLLHVYGLRWLYWDFVLKGRLFR